MMYTNAQYMINTLSGNVVFIQVDINGVTSFVPIDPMNGDYDEIMRLVAAGDLVIAPAS
jgi:hypothetical protein